MDMAETESPFGGTGNYQNLGDAVAWLRVIDPRKVLDVGCGFGRWGFLCREFLDVWNGRVFRRDWQVQLIGVDAYESNLKDHHRLLYDEVHGMEVERFLAERSDRFDLTILGDVLEHFPKLAGLELLRQCMERSSYVLLILPIGSHWPQQAIYGNPYERHLGVWEDTDVLRLEPLVACSYRDYIDRPYLGAVLSKDDPKALKARLIEATPSISSRPIRLQGGAGALPQATSQVGSNGEAGGQKLHVALVTVEYPPLFGGGIATYAYHAARVLGEAGHRVTVLTRPWQGETPQLPNVEVYPIPELPNPGLPRWELNWLYQHLRFGEQISRRLTEVHAEHPLDVIEVTDYYHEGLFLDSSKLIREDGSPVPVVTQFHGPRCVIAGLDGVMPAALLQSAEQLALAGCEYAKTYSTLMRDQANDLWPGTGCEFVPAAFYPSAGTPPVSREPFEFDLLYFGKVELRKGMVPFARAIQELSQRGIQPSVCFVGRDTDTPPGGGSMIEWLERELRPVLGSKLHFRDAVPQNQLWDLLAKARIIVIPSLWESLGFAAWEAFCSGRPVICSSKVAAATVLEESLASRTVVDIDDVSGFAATIADLLNASPQELNTLAERARASVLEACRPERISTLSAEYYTWCIERARTQGGGRRVGRAQSGRFRDLLLQTLKLIGEASGHQAWELNEAREVAAKNEETLRRRIAELEEARDLLAASLDEVRSVRAAEGEVLRARIAELEATQAGTRDQQDGHLAELQRSLRHAGLKMAALRAETDYVREEAGRLRWELEQELATSRGESDRTRGELEAMRLECEDVRASLAAALVELETARTALAEAQPELARLHEVCWRMERTLTFRVRRFGGKVLRGLGLRR